MEHPTRPPHGLAVRLFERLLRLYPAGFGREFSEEIHAVFMKRMQETARRGGLSWLDMALREITGLMISILREHWHARRSSKEKAMAVEEMSGSNSGAGGAGWNAGLPAGAPGLRWVVGWTLLTTAAVPTALVAMAPLAAAVLGLLDHGSAGRWSDTTRSLLLGVGFVIGLALTLAAAQWGMLRRRLPRAWMWAVATGMGIVLGGIAAGVALLGFSAQGRDPLLYMAVALLLIGLALGLAHWLYLRRVLPNAYWILVIDLLTTGSILLAGRSFASLIELAVILLLPGAVSGVGLWLLLRSANPETSPSRGPEAAPARARRFPQATRVGLALIALVPVFFACLWVYATSQLALAKAAGVYDTPEAAVIARSSQGWGEAEVVGVENVRVSPNSDTAQPHVWFGGATVTLDRPLPGSDHDYIKHTTGSFYLRVREGWVYVPEGAFPEIIGWAMELYGMEGVPR